MFGRYSYSGLILMAAPLYAGPLLAGWSLAPWQTGAVLAGIFFLMQLFRGIGGVGDNPFGALAVLLLAAVQIMLVAVFVAAGLLGANLTRSLDLPVWVPLALTSFGAVIWGWRYRANAEMAEISAAVDSALSSIETARPFEPDKDRADDKNAPLERAVQEALKALWALPENAGAGRIGQIDQIVQTLETRTGAGAFHALQSELLEGFPIIDLAMLRYLASPNVRRQLVDSRDLGFALSLLIDSQDTGVIHELAALTATLLDENTPASELPPPDELRRQSHKHPVLAPLVEPVEAAYRAWQQTCG